MGPPLSLEPVKRRLSWLQCQEMNKSPLFTRRCNLQVRHYPFTSHYILKFSADQLNCANAYFDEASQCGISTWRSLDHTRYICSSVASSSDDPEVFKTVADFFGSKQSCMTRARVFPWYICFYNISYRTF